MSDVKMRQLNPPIPEDVTVTRQANNLTAKTLLSATAAELIEEIGRLRGITLREAEVDFEDDEPEIVEVIEISSEEGGENNPVR